MAEKARRERRIRMVGGILVGAVAIVAVLIAVSSGSGSSGLQSGKAAAQTTTAVEQMLAGIPQNGQTLGSTSAPVTVYYYGDLQCPVCKAFTLQGGFSQLVANDVKAGKVKVIYRSIETATHDTSTFQTQQSAALAAGAQGHFWDYVELFYREQSLENSGYVNNTFLTGLAKQIPGLNLSLWQSTRQSQSSAYATQLQSDAAQGNRDSVAGTPTLIAQGPKGKAAAQGTVPDYPALQAAIKSVA